MEGVICDCCGSHSKGIREFSEFSHLKPCAIKSIEGVVRQSVEPVFTKFRELCFTCYNAAVKKYVTETKRPKE